MTRSQYWALVHYCTRYYTSNNDDDDDAMQEIKDKSWYSHST